MRTTLFKVVGAVCEHANAQENAQEANAVPVRRARTAFVSFSRSLARHARLTLARHRARLQSPCGAYNNVKTISTRTNAVRELTKRGGAAAHAPVRGRDICVDGHQSDFLSIPIDVYPCQKHEKRARTLRISLATRTALPVIASSLRANAVHWVRVSPLRGDSDVVVRIAGTRHFGVADGANAPHASAGYSSVGCSPRRTLTSHPADAPVRNHFHPQGS